MEQLPPTKTLMDRAEELAGRPVEVTTTGDGKYVVEWFCFKYPPPPKADCVEDALEGFIRHMEKAPKLDEN